MSPSRRDLLALSGAALAGLAGCIDAPTDPSGPGANPAATGPVSSGQSRSTPTVDAGTVEALVRGNTAFALDLHRQLVAAEADANLLASPYSVSVALAMAWAGARGETESQMSDALRFPFGQDRLHPAFNALDRRVDPPQDDTAGTGRGETTRDGSDSGSSDASGRDDGDGQPFRLDTVNALWGQAGYPFDDAFLDVLARNYGAGLRTLDFAADPGAARKRINAWIAERTGDRVRDLLPPDAVDTLTRLVLTNAVYFEARWQHTFEEHATEDRSFTALDGAESTVPTMRQTETFPYAAVDGHQLVELPYEGGDASTVVVLPAEGEFERFERGLTAERLHALLDALEPTGVELSLPTFTYESTFSLPDALSALGMPVAFDPNRADFGGMVEGDGNPGLYVSEVVHRSVIDVDEEGTEAAAATAVAVNVTSAVMTETEMTVDRPFLYLIRDRDTGAVVFLGRVVDAAAAQ